MDFNLSLANIIVILLAIGIIFLIIKSLKKIIRAILIIITVLGLAYYVFIFSNMFKAPGEHSKYSIENIKDKYCTNMANHADSVKCFMIITPIYDDIKSQYTEEELLELERNPIEYFKMLNAAIKRNKGDIIKNLAKNKEEQIWDNFVNDLKKNYPNQQIAQ